MFHIGVLTTHKKRCTIETTFKVNMEEQMKFELSIPEFSNYRNGQDAEYGMGFLNDRLRRFFPQTFIEVYPDGMRLEDKGYVSVKLMPPKYRSNILLICTVFVFDNEHSTTHFEIDYELQYRPIELCDLIKRDFLLELSEDLLLTDTLRLDFYVTLFQDTPAMIEYGDYEALLEIFEEKDVAYHEFATRSNCVNYCTFIYKEAHRHRFLELKVKQTPTRALHYKRNSSFSL